MEQKAFHWSQSDNRDLFVEDVCYSSRLSTSVNHLISKGWHIEAIVSEWKNLSSHSLMSACILCSRSSNKVKS